MRLPIRQLQTPNPSRPWATWTALIAVYVIWGSTYLAIRFAIETLPPFLMAGARFLLAGAVLYAWRRVRGDPRPTARQWRSAAIVGGFLLLGGNGGVVWAEQRIVSSVAALLVSTVPLWMALLDLLRPAGRRPGWREIVGLVIGFAGVAILVRPTSSSGAAGGVDLAGAGALILGAFLWSIGSLYSRQAPLPSSPLLATGMQMLAGGAGLFLLGTLVGEWRHLDPGAFSPRSLWGLAYLVVFGSLVGFTAYTWLLRTAPTSLVSTYAYVNPLVAILLGHWLDGDPLTLRGLLAAAVIVGSVALITVVKPASTKPKAHRPEFVPAKEN